MREKPVFSGNCEFVPSKSKIDFEEQSVRVMTDIELPHFNVLILKISP